MEIKVYYSQKFCNEDSKLGILGDFNMIETDESLTRKNDMVEGSDTTLKELYSKGWKLSKVASAHNSNTSFFFFMEK